MHSLWVQRLTFMVVGCATIVLASIAHAANTDPFAYDPQFNNGVILEDRFASTTASTAMLGERALISPHYIGDPNGDIVASGLVAAAYQGSPGNNFGSVRTAVRASAHRGEPPNLLLRHLCRLSQ